MMAAHVNDARELLWNAYEKDKDDTVYNELINSYLPLVRFIVSRLNFKLPNHLEQEDLVSYGIFGLMDAVKKFDWTRGVKFETYASQRIRGAVVDALRREQWAPRSVTDRFKALQRAYQKLENEGVSDVSEKQLAKEMQISVKTLREIMAEFSQLSVVSLDEVLHGQEIDNISRGDTLADPQSPNPVARVLEDEYRDYLAAAIDELPEKDRLVISLYYYEELTLREIGLILEVSESRVSQLHARALMRLREKLSKYLGATVGHEE